MTTKPQRSQEWLQREIDRLQDLRSETHDPNLQNEYTMQIMELGAEWNELEHQRLDNDMLQESHRRMIKDMGRLVARVSTMATVRMVDAYSVGTSENGYQDHQLANMHIASLGNQVRDLNEAWLKVERLLLDIEATTDVVENIANYQ